VFDYDYEEIDQIVGKSASNCRQIVRRAKQHLLQKRPRFDVSQQRKEKLVEQFLQACHAGDLQGLITLLAEDITLIPDRGGHLPALNKPLHGAVKVAKFLLVIRKKMSVSQEYKVCKINGQPGVTVYIDGQLHSVMTFDFTSERIQSVFLLANPDKLKRG
jgi:RNA polymerase sigma-70 factor (ECF subfamily)